MLRRSAVTASRAHSWLFLANSSAVLSDLDR
jgi:hypothetical protein